MSNRGMNVSEFLTLFIILLLFLGGFKISFNNHTFEWIGLFEMVLSWFK